MTTIQVEDLSSVKKKVTLEVPESKVAEVIDSQYRDLKKNVQLKGFRKGKAPLEVIRSYFKSQVEEEAARKLIEETFQPALDEKKITPVSVIKIDPESLELGKPFKYTAEIEVPPPIDVQDYKGIELTKNIRSLDEKQVDERLQNLRERNARLSPIPDRPIQEGDHLVVDIKSEVDGQVVDSLTVTDYHIEIGRDFYLPEFDKNLTGMKVDESKQVTLDLPEDFPRKAIAGKTATFDILVKEAKERILPELDDDFAKDLGEFETLEAVREEIRKDIQENSENQTKREIENGIIDFLIEKNEFEVPAAMVEQQVEQTIKQSLQSLVMHGIDPKQMPAPTEAQRIKMRPAAVRIVKAGLLIKAVGEKEDIEVSDNELETGIQERAEQLGMSVDYLKDQLEQNSMLEDMRAGILQDKIYKFIEKNAIITEKEVSELQESAESDTETAGKE